MRCLGAEYHSGFDGEVRISGNLFPNCGGEYLSAHSFGGDSDLRRFSDYKHQPWNFRGDPFFHPGFPGRGHCPVWPGKALEQGTDDAPGVGTGGKAPLPETGGCGECGRMVPQEGDKDRLFLPVYSRSAKPDIHSCRHEPYGASHLFSLHDSGIRNLEYRAHLPGSCLGRILGENRLFGRGILPHYAHCAVYQCRQRHSVVLREPSETFIKGETPISGIWENEGNQM